MKEVKTPWDAIPKFYIAKCCGTCDCNMPNNAVQEHEEMLKRESKKLKRNFSKLPGMSYPYPIWCTKHKAETCKYGCCSEWEED